MCSFYFFDESSFELFQFILIFHFDLAFILVSVLELGFKFIDSFLLLAATLLQLCLYLFAFGVLLQPVGEILNGEGWFLAISLGESLHQDVGNL